MICQYNEHAAFRGDNLYKKYKHDAGWDIRTPVGFSIEPMSSCVVNTGLHIRMPKGMKGIIQSRSGCSIKHRIEACNAGVIDYGYTGSCNICLYNFSQDTAFVFKEGDKVAQIVFDFSHTVSGLEMVKLYWDLFTKGIPKVIPEVPLELWPATDRGDNGFGSTD
jgi:deoxyuridine 5'-triphosphate nucleotidohydrolase